MANSPAPKAPGKSSAAGGEQSTSQYFQQINKGGPYYGAGGPPPVFGGPGVPPPFAPYTPTPEGPGEGSGEGGDLETVSYAATIPDYSTDEGEAAEVQPDLPPGAYGTLEEAIQSVGDTFVNPFTGDLENTQEAYATLMTLDPSVQAEQNMQMAMAKLAAEKTAAMQQQKAQFAAAGLGASGAMSADIAGTGAAYAGQAATTALQIENEKITKLDLWNDKKLAYLDEIGDLKEGMADAFGVEIQGATDEIHNYIDSEMANAISQAKGAELHTNNNMLTMIRDAITLMETNNVGKDQAMPILKQIVDWYLNNGVAFHQIHKKTGGYVYPMHDPKTSYGNAASPGGNSGTVWYKGEIKGKDSDYAPKYLYETWPDDLIWD
jgi:hypothetical protein